MSPILFNIYISSLSNLGDGNVVCFADDIAISVEEKDTNLCEKKMNKLLATFSDKCSSLDLKISDSKTKAMYFTYKQGRPSIYIENVQVEIVDKFKYLGVIVDNRLTFKNHIEYIKKKIRMSCGAFYYLSKIGKGLNFFKLVNLYKTFIRPKIDYGSPVVSIMTKSKIEQLNSIQHGFLTASLKIDRISRKIDTRVFCNILSVENRYCQLNTKFFSRLNVQP